jgi:hypothetical protein
LSFSSPTRPFPTRLHPSWRPSCAPPFLPRGRKPLFRGTSNGAVMRVLTRHGLALANARGLPFGFFFRQFGSGLRSSHHRTRTKPRSRLPSRRREALSPNDFVHCGRHRNGSASLCINSAQRPSFPTDRADDVTRTRAPAREKEPLWDGRTGGSTRRWLLDNPDDALGEISRALTPGLDCRFLGVLAE